MADSAYLLITPITVYTSPFVSQSVNALSWTITEYSRTGGSAKAAISMVNLNDDGSLNTIVYSYQATIPEAQITGSTTALDSYIISTNEQYRVRS